MQSVSPDEDWDHQLEVRSRSSSLSSTINIDAADDEYNTHR